MITSCYDFRNVLKIIYSKQFKMSILIYKLDYFFRFNQFGYMFIICTIENNRKNMRHGSLIYCLQNLFPVVFRKLICNPLFLYCVCMLIYLRFQPEIWHKLLIQFTYVSFIGFYIATFITVKIFRDTYKSFWSKCGY